MVRVKRLGEGAIPLARAMTETRRLPLSRLASQGRRVALLAAAALSLSACDPRDCALGIASGDCAPQGSPLAAFPQDDAICRSYGLVPGTHDYRLCRQAKGHVRALTERETDYGFLNNPLTPSIK